jgi:hypothetical protein
MCEAIVPRARSALTGWTVARHVPGLLPGIKDNENGTNPAVHGRTIDLGRLGKMADSVSNAARNGAQ